MRYLSVAIEEGKHHIAQANVPLTKDNRFEEELIVARNHGDVLLGRARRSFRRRVAEAAVSVAAALIPFLENDDANRALMGSNMQRQAVPLVRNQCAARRHRHGSRCRA